MVKLKKIPKFKNEGEEAAFWNRELDMPYQTLIKQYIFKGLGMGSV